MKLLIPFVSWLLGILFSVIGLINVFSGNDPFFGLFILALSLVFYPPIDQFITKIFGFQIPGFLKIFLALFILWASLGVGELFDKTENLIDNILK